MKKVCPKVEFKQGAELSKRIYRTIAEQAKKLDDARSCSTSIGELFSPSLRALRRKFCEYCERLIFIDPLCYGKKIEELLWRKGHYDVISTSKKLKKMYSSEDLSNLQSHINAGLGFYHHIIVKLQYQFNINLNNIDFPLDLDETFNVKELEEELVNWASHTIYQCLIYLGDLNRYKLDIYPNLDATLAKRYYLQAIKCKPDFGMPHNQMGMLAMNQSNNLEAVYHYLRCLACKFPFEGTMNNLQSVLDKNTKYVEQLPVNKIEKDDCVADIGQSDIIKRFIGRFLLLIDIWYFNKKVQKVYNLCHQTYKDLEECLSFTRPSSSESGDKRDFDAVGTEAVPTYISCDMLFKIVATCLLCISKLQASSSSQLPTIITFTLAIYSQIIQHITGHIQEAVLNYPLPIEDRVLKSKGIIHILISENNSRVKSKIRRRKALKIESDEDSDLSEHDINVNYSSSEEDSLISDAEDALAESSEDECDNIKVSNESISETFGENQYVSASVPTETNKKNGNIYRKVQCMDVNDMLEIINEEGSLQSIKIMNDWLSCDREILKSCGANTRILIKQISSLINMVNINLNSPKILGIRIKPSDVLQKAKLIPLSEDVVLKNLGIFKDSQKDLDWNYFTHKCLTTKEESLVRIVKLISFGKLLLNTEETGVQYDLNKNIFVCKTLNKLQVNSNSATPAIEELELQQLDSSFSSNSYLGEKPESPYGQLNKMKHMGQLWLAAEVQSLENRVEGSRSELSPYLVLDVDSLMKYTNIVKHLVYSRKFILVVPSAVVSALDDLKREKLEARDVIRWLESQFHRGNRFFRSQRQHENAALPFIKYPKKRDKEMAIYIQIIECCYYLAQQQKHATNLVTLLIGNQNILSNGDNKDFSYVGLAQSMGITIETLTGFYGKWKKNKR